MKELALFLLYNHKNEVLLQLRDDKAQTYPNQYGFFGGRIEDGETPEVAVKRECLEELEYTLENPKLIFDEVVETELGLRKVFLFIEEFDSSKNLILHEGAGMLWVGKNDLMKIKVINFLLDIIKEHYPNN